MAAVALEPKCASLKTPRDSVVVIVHEEAICKCDVCQHLIADSRTPDIADELGEATHCGNSAQVVGARVIFALIHEHQTTPVKGDVANCAIHINNCRRATLSNRAKAKRPGIITISIRSADVRECRLDARSSPLNVDETTAVCDAALSAAPQGRNIRSGIDVTTAAPPGIHTPRKLARRQINGRTAHVKTATFDTELLAVVEDNRRKIRSLGQRLAFRIGIESYSVGTCGNGDSEKPEEKHKGRNNHEERFWKKCHLCLNLWVGQLFDR